MTEADFGGKFCSSFCQHWSNGEVRWLVPTSAHEDGGLSSRASPGWAWKVPLGKWNPVSPLLGPDKLTCIGSLVFLPYFSG